jgi:hypothetical protein
MNQKLLLLPIIAVLALHSCGSSNQQPDFKVKKTIASTEEANPSAPSIYNPNEQTALTEGKVEVETNDAKQYATQILQLVNQHHGQTKDYNFETTISSVALQQISIDSALEVQQLTPKASLNVTLPIQNADSFVSKIMAMDGTILHLNLGGHHQVDAPISNDSKAIATDGIVSSNNIKYSTNKNSFTCVIQINGKPYIVKTATASISSYETPLYLQALSAIKTGLKWLAYLGILLLYILPIALVVFGIYKIIIKLLPRRLSKLPQ